jgi:hypothetical protein
MVEGSASDATTFFAAFLYTKYPIFCSWVTTRNGDERNSASSRLSTSGNFCPWAAGRPHIEVVRTHGELRRCKLAEPPAYAVDDDLCDVTSRLQQLYTDEAGWSSDGSGSIEAGGVA